MSGYDYLPELARDLDRLVPVDEPLAGDWDDVVARVDVRRKLRIGRGRQRRLHVAIVFAVLFLLVAGVATATYLLVGGNGEIAFDAGFGKLLAVNPNAPGLHAVARCAAGTQSCAVLQPAFSPDGKRLAFVRGRSGGPNSSGKMTLYVAASDGRDVRPLAACGGCGEQWSGRFGWSPDGQWIVFSRDAGPTGQESLWMVAASGGRLHRLTGCEPAWCADVSPVWSPDGQLIAFDRITIARGTVNRLYTVRPDGSGLTRIAAGSDLQWSPDGQKIAFDGHGRVEVANADGSDARLVFAGAAGTGPGTPSWSPDGSKLVVFRTPGQPGHYRVEVWTLNADGTGKKRLYRSGCCVMWWAVPVWSPDGRLIAFAANSAGGTFVIHADGTGLRRLSPITASSLSWQRRNRS